MNSIPPEEDCPLILKDFDHIVMFSRGVGSWMAAKRVAAKYGTDRLHLLFTDTQIEDDDLYRFLNEASVNVGGTLHKIADGRDPFQVFKDVKMMGNSRIDPCSRILKRELADKWIAKNFKSETTRIYVGIDWSEEHRYTRMAKRKLPWVYKAPMTESPYIDKNGMFWALKKENIELPKLYKMGFMHNNCGGFCIKTGQAQFKKLFSEMPKRYLELEKREEEVYDHIGSRHPFIRMTIKGTMHYLSMREFRTKYLETSSDMVDVFDWGGCGCFIDDPE